VPGHFLAVIALALAVSVAEAQQPPVRSEPPAGAQAAFSKGVEALQKQEFGSAIRFLSDAQRVSPTDPAILFSLGFAHGKERHEDEAIEWLEAYLTALPQAENSLKVRQEIDRLKSALTGKGKLPRQPSNEHEALLELIGAEKSLELARSAGAEQYAMRTFSRAQSLTALARARYDKRNDNDSVRAVEYAREAAQTADDARLIAQKSREVEELRASATAAARAQDDKLQLERRAKEAAARAAEQLLRKTEEDRQEASRQAQEVARLQTVLNVMRLNSSGVRVNPNAEAEKGGSGRPQCGEWVQKTVTVTARGVDELFADADLVVNITNSGGKADSRGGNLDISLGARARFPVSFGLNGAPDRQLSPGDSSRVAVTTPPANDGEITRQPMVVRYCRDK
jgi:hypothetical protein